DGPPIFSCAPTSGCREQARILQLASVCSRLRPACRAVYGSRDLPAGAVDRDACVLRVLEQLRAAPRRRDVYAAPSLWRAGPRAMVLDGVAWEAVRPRSSPAWDWP